MKRIIILVVLITSLIVGGGIYYWQNGVASIKDKSNREQIKKLEEQVKTLMTSGDINLGKNINTESRTNVNGPMSGEAFAVYGMDENVQEKQVNFYIDIAKNITLSDKIKVIVDTLSRFKFANLPIELVKINDKDGKKIAVINLKESQLNEGVVLAEKLKGENWRSGYFQGSAGGAATSYSLIETMLQRKYTGEWIDGVEFLYESKPINQWQHAEELSKVIYRK